MSRPRVLTIQHEDACPPDWFGEWLSAAGIDLEVVMAHRGDPVPPALDGQVGLLVLGGQMGANDDATVPWLPATKELIRHTVGAAQPLLGICLGHQIATAALGGEVTRNPKGHAGGLTPVGLNDAGRSDPLLQGTDGLPSVQWNDDIAARLPTGAVQLGTAPDGSVQAARFGPRAWGVQFHPEASPAVFRGWSVDKPSPSPRAIAAAAAVDAAEAELVAAWRPLAERFAALCLGLLGDLGATHVAEGGPDALGGVVERGGIR